MPAMVVGTTPNFSPSMIEWCGQSASQTVMTLEKWKIGGCKQSEKFSVGVHNGMPAQSRTGTSAPKSPTAATSCQSINSMAPRGNSENVALF